MLDDDLPDLQFSPSASSGKEQCSTKQDGLPTASFASQRKACKIFPGLRKGFLSGASANPNNKGGVRCRSKPRTGRDDIEDISMPKEPQKGPGIPDFLRLPLTEAEKKGLMYRNALEEVMQPDEATLRQILDSDEVLEGFDDPAVMAAVQEIAQHPDALSKHARDAKVVKFYESMEVIMRPKLLRAAAKAKQGPGAKQ